MITNQCQKWGTSWALITCSQSAKSDCCRSYWQPFTYLLEITGVHWEYQWNVRLNLKSFAFEKTDRFCLFFSSVTSCSLVPLPYSTWWKHLRNEACPFKKDNRTMQKSSRTHMQAFVFLTTTHWNYYFSCDTINSMFYDNATNWIEQFAKSIPNLK